MFVLDQAPEWFARAACGGAAVDPEPFFAPGPDAEIEALQVCRRCEVRPDCLAHALEHHETVGIWGGRTQADLINLRRRLTRQARRG